MNWLEVKGYEGLYEVSDIGLVKSLSRTISSYYRTRVCKEKILKQYLDKYGYNVVTLYKNGKPRTAKVHRLVALAFLGESELVVNHKDFNKQNNNLSNLEFVSVKENNVHAYSNPDRNICKGQTHYRYRLTSDDRAKIRKLVMDGMHKKEIAEIFKIHPNTIYKILKD